MVSKPWFDIPGQARVTLRLTKRKKRGEEDKRGREEVKGGVLRTKPEPPFGNYRLQTLAAPTTWQSTESTWWVCRPRRKKYLAPPLPADTLPGPVRPTPPPLLGNPLSMSKTKAHPPFRLGLLGGLVLADVPPERKPERKHIRQNHPFTKPPFCLPATYQTFRYL